MDRNTLPGCDKAMVLNRVCRRALWKKMVAGFENPPIQKNF
jgi:hypothetical protein